MKKLLICLLVAFMCFLCVAQALAEEETASPEASAETAKETTKDETEETYTGPEINAPSAILIDEATGTVLVQKNADAHLDPAGLTKIMSVYLACLNLSETDYVTLSSEVSNSYDHSTSVIWVMEGEKIQVLDLEYASLIQNANDTTAMLADKVSGSSDAFVKKMNDMAKELEMNNTNYQNIFGLNNENNYSSARDIATLVRKAVKNDTFAKIFGASNWTISPTNLQSNSRVLAQGCEFLRSGDHYNSDVDGCKVGYTAEGGYALVTKATKNDTSYIAVVLNEESENNCYDDINTLLDYGFENYHTIEITPSDIGTKEVEVYDGKKHIADITFSISDSFTALLSTNVKKEDLTTEIVVSNESSPVADDIEAEVHFLLNGEVVSTASMKKTVKDVSGTSNSEVVKKETSQIRQYFDYFCIGILGLLIFRKLSVLLAPPKQ